MPKWSTSALNDPKKYRFGFNGKEDDDEWAKQDYGFRIYDGRIGRFLSVDPLMGSYPELTTYQFASNTPIQAIDLDGLEAITMVQYEELKRIAKNESSFVKNTINKPTYDPRTGEFVDIPYTTWSLKDNSLSLSGSGLNLIESKNDIIFNCVFNGENIKTKFNTSGASTSFFNAPDLPIGTLSKLYKISRSLAEVKEGTILNQLDATLKERGITEDTRNFATNAFRHTAFSAIMTYLYDENTAKTIGDAHERDDTGFTGNGGFYDSTIDIINNAYGRVLGNELKAGSFRDADLSSPNTMSLFLNRVFENVSNAVPGLGSNNVFNSEQKEVKNLTDKIK